MTQVAKTMRREPDPTRPVCPQNVRRRIVSERTSVSAINDRYPVSPVHMLVIPVRHTKDFFTVTEQERIDANSLLLILQEQLSADDSMVTGFNIGVNCGISAGHSIMHAHIHFIPRRDGDMPQPRGGVRGVIPERQAYTG